MDDKYLNPCIDREDIVWYNEYNRYQMITNPKKLRKFEQNLLKRDTTSIDQKFRLMDAMFKEARSLRVFPLKNPLEGLETDIKVAKVVNSVRKST